MLCPLLLGRCFVGSLGEVVASPIGEDVDFRADMGQGASGEGRRRARHRRYSSEAIARGGTRSQQFMLKNSAVGEIVYRLMLSSQRQRLHKQIADWYQRLCTLNKVPRATVVAARQVQ